MGWYTPHLGLVRSYLPKYQTLVCNIYARIKKKRSRGGGLPYGHKGRVTQAARRIAIERRTPSQRKAARRQRRKLFI